jgi:hypothetical protein
MPIHPLMTELGVPAVAAQEPPLFWVDCTLPSARLAKDAAEFGMDATARELAGPALANVTASVDAKMPLPDVAT